jgi:hypothetical protein
VGPDGLILIDDDRFFIFIVSADGSDSQLIFRSPGGPDSGELRLRFTWSEDGKTLYLSRRVPVVRGSRTAERRAEIIVWREGARAAVLSRLPGPSPDLHTALLPGGNLLVSSGKRLWSIGPAGKLQRMPDAVARSFAEGTLLGLDSQGRAILKKWEENRPSYVAAADLTTGELTRIYP